MKRMLFAVLCAALIASLTSCSAASEPSTTSRGQAAIDYTTLDTSWECDYLKIAVSSKWQGDDNLSNDLTFAHWYWGNDDVFHFVDFTLSHNSDYKQLSQKEVTERWSNFKEYALEDDTLKADYEGDYVEDTFVKSGQAYLIIANEKNDKKEIQFYANGLHGTFSYDNIDTDIVMSMIDSIVFY